MSAPPHPTVAPPDATVVPRLIPHRPDASLGAHLARLGPPPRPTRSLVEQVEAAGVRGRGGAGFPTGVKMAAVAARSRTRGPIVVANGTEGEPASAKDQTLLVHVPHLVLDGMVAAAGAVGAREAILCVDRRHRHVVDAVGRAVGERQGRWADTVAVRVAQVPSRYVAGEESALVHWLNGGEAKPTSSPPRPFERGVDGRPTLVDNVETLAHVALVARFGAEWYRAIGTPDEPGTVLLTVGGHAARGGVYEVPSGVPLAALLDNAGAPLAELAGVLVGGYFGTWLDPATAAAVAVDHSSLRAVGGSLGCGVVFALPRGHCGLAETARIARWLAGEGAQQCGPCAHGLPAMAEAMEHLSAGGPGASRAHVRLHQLFVQVEGRGACRHPDGAVRMVRSALEVFAADAAAHAAGRPCPPAPAWLPTPAPGGWR